MYGHDDITFRIRHSWQTTYVHIKGVVHRKKAIVSITQQGKRDLSFLFRWSNIWSLCLWLGLYPWRPNRMLPATRLSAPTQLFIPYSPTAVWLSLIGITRYLEAFALPRYHGRDIGLTLKYNCFYVYMLSASSPTAGRFHIRLRIYDENAPNSSVRTVEPKLKIWRFFVRLPSSLTMAHCLLFLLTPTLLWARHITAYPPPYTMGSSTMKDQLSLI